MQLAGAAARGSLRVRRSEGALRNVEFGITDELPAAEAEIVRRLQGERMGKLPRKPSTQRKRLLAGPLWRCPKCGHRFVTANLWHSCGRFRLADHFVGKAPVLRGVFRAWLAAARTAGPVTAYAQKTRIVFQARVRFAGAVVHKTWLDAGLWLKRRAAHPRLYRVESFGALGYGHHFRLERVADLDAGLRALVREAYAIAAQREPSNPPKSAGA